MKKLFLSIILVVVVCALSATVLAFDTAKIGGKILTGGVPVDVVVPLTFDPDPWGGRKFGARTDREGNFHFFLPVFFGLTEAKIVVLGGKDFTCASLVQVAPNTCQKITLHRR